MIDFLDGMFAVIIFSFSMLLVLELMLGIYYYNKLRLQTVDSHDATKNVVLIPAHNESEMIAITLALLKSELGPLDKIVVVADNCTDSTVSICSEYEVIVIERSSSDKLGKGYALEFGANWALENLDFDSLVIFDADCKFTPGSFATLVAQTNSKGKIHQASYLMKAENADSKRKVSEFTWWIKNAVRATGLTVLKLGCHIQGSGIAFPKNTLKNVDFASGSIVEDLELGLKLSIDKNDVIYFPASCVVSYFPSNEQGLHQQRQRWEHGHLDTILKFPSFVLKAIKRKSTKAIFLIADAAIPPLFAYLTLLVLAFLLGLLFSVFGSSILMFISLGSILAIGSAVMLAWLIRGYHILQVSDLIGIAKFLKDKISVYATFFTKKQTKWVRTTRDDKKNDKK